MEMLRLLRQDGQSDFFLRWLQRSCLPQERWEAWCFSRQKSIFLPELSLSGICEGSNILQKKFDDFSPFFIFTSQTHVRHNKFFYQKLP